MFSNKNLILLFNSERTSTFKKEFEIFLLRLFKLSLRIDSTSLTIVFLLLIFCFLEISIFYTIIHI